MRNPHVPPGFWRGVNLNQNTIYLECFLDEVAAATRQDPLALRRKLMDKHPKHLAVLNAVAERVKWGTASARCERPEGIPRAGTDAWLWQLRGGLRRGLRQRRRPAHGAPHRGRHRPRLCRQPAADRGAGGRLVSSMACRPRCSACTVKDGRIEQDNFSTYPVMHMRHMPKVETILVASGGFWGGVGEPTIAVAAPAVLNAIYAATHPACRASAIRPALPALPPP
jgi:isoquinoline 1-oxidoreductase beta subunit